MSSFEYSRLTEDANESFIKSLNEYTHLPRDTCSRIAAFLPTQKQFTVLGTIKYYGKYSLIQFILFVTINIFHYAMAIYAISSEHSIFGGLIFSLYSLLESFSVISVYRKYNGFIKPNPTTNEYNIDESIISFNKELYCCLYICWISMTIPLFFKELVSTKVVKIMIVAHVIFTSITSIYSWCIHKHFGRLDNLLKPHTFYYVNPINSAFINLLALITYGIISKSLTITIISSIIFYPTIQLCFYTNYTEIISKNYKFGEYYTYHLMLNCSECITLQLFTMYMYNHFSNAFVYGCIAVWISSAASLAFVNGNFSWFIYRRGEIELSYRALDMNRQDYPSAPETDIYGVMFNYWNDIIMEIFSYIPTFIILQYYMYNYNFETNGWKPQVIALVSMYLLHGFLRFCHFCRLFWIHNVKRASWRTRKLKQLMYWNLFVGWVIKCCIIGWAFGLRYAESIYKDLFLNVLSVAFLIIGTVSMGLFVLVFCFCVFSRCRVWCHDGDEMYSIF